MLGGVVLCPFSRLQGLLRRCTSRPRAPPRRRPHRGRERWGLRGCKHLLRHPRSRLQVSPGRLGGGGGGRRGGGGGGRGGPAGGGGRADARLERTRSFVKIQDGCSFSCAFCVIPLVRGGTRSRRAGAVLAEILRRVAPGHREIVLTGRTPG